MRAYLLIYLLALRCVVLAQVKAPHEPTPQNTISVFLTAGWNLVSLPVIPQDCLRTNLFPTAISRAFTYDTKYVTKDTLVPGKAYWLKFSSPETVKVFGEPFISETVSVNRGWNLIGALSVPTDTGAITTTPDRILRGGYYGYDRSAGYKTVPSLQPGKGYWVKASQAGLAHQGCWASPENILVYPPHDTILLTPPVLKWRHSLCVQEYHLQLALDSIFTTIVVDSIVTDTSFQSFYNCISNDCYWRVGVPAQGTAIIWSGSRSFRLTYPRQALLLPVDKGDAALEPVLQWQRSPCIGRYRLQISEDSIFSSPVTDTTLSDTSYNADTLSLARDYYWRIKGIEGRGDTEWTFPYKFHTAAWQYLGLNTEMLNWGAVDWFDSRVIYVGSHSSFTSGKAGGLFKSTDAGAAWDTLIRGLSVNDVEIDPRNHSIIYCVSMWNGLTPYPGIIKSTDAGLTWTISDSGIFIDWDTSPGGISIDPVHPETLYAGTVGAFGGDVFKSTNGGKFWTATGLGRGIQAIDVDRNNDANVYAAEYQLQTLYKSIDYASSWVQVHTPTPVWDIKVSSVSSDTLFLAADSGMYVSGDAGTTWNSASDGLESSLTIYSLSISQIDPHRLFAAGIYRDGKRRIFRTDNSGVFWRVLPAMPIGEAGSIMLSPVDDLYCLNWNGIFRYIR